jgi:cell division protein FtsZ
MPEVKAPSPPVERTVPETQGMETHAASQRAATAEEAEATAMGEEESIFELDDSEEDDGGGFENETEEEPIVAKEHVVSLPVRIATVPAKAQQPDPEPRVRQPKPVARPEPAMAGAAAKGTPVAQPSLNLHQDEVTRFKGTEKNIVEGEDLDVPTWMRMKQRTR